MARFCQREGCTLVPFAMRARFLFSLIVLGLLASGCDATGPSAARVGYAVDGAASVTYTDADGTTKTATPNAAWRLDVDAPQGQSLVLTAASTSGAPVTATITVDNVLVASRRGASVRVESSSSSSGSEVEVYGLVEALGSDRVTVSGLTFVVDAQTRLYDRNNQTVPLSTFAVGTFVEAEGRLLGDGTYRAKKIKLEDDDGDSGEIEVHGTLQAIDAESMSVAGRRFVTGPSTRYLDDDGDPISRDAFRVGDLVEAEGYALADGTLRAEKVKLDDD